VQGVNEYNGYVITPLVTASDDFGYATSNNTTALTVIQCDPNIDLFKCKQAQVSVSGYLGVAITRDFNDASTYASLAKSLCTQLTTIPTGVPKTARSVTIGILAKASTTPYGVTYFTAPKSKKCT
jgi:hypothetical protein